jgi:hypothetical protein
MNRTEFKLFESLKKLGDKKTGWSDPVIDQKAKNIIDKITQTKFYKSNPYFSKQLMTKYNFLDLTMELMKKECKQQ